MKALSHAHDLVTPMLTCPVSAADTCEPVFCFDELRPSPVAEQWRAAPEFAAELCCSNKKSEDRDGLFHRVSPTVERRDVRASSEQLWHLPDVAAVVFVNASVRSDETVSL